MIYKEDSVAFPLIAGFFSSTHLIRLLKKSLKITASNCDWSIPAEIGITILYAPIAILAGILVKNKNKITASELHFSVALQ